MSKKAATRKPEMYERFTDRARRVMQLANREALRFNQEFIGTEHILLGLVIEPSGVAGNVLRHFGVDLRDVRRDVERVIQKGAGRNDTKGWPRASPAKMAIEYSMEEARHLGHNYVGTEHLLLGILCQEDGAAAKLLGNYGMNVRDTRDQILAILATGYDLDPEVVSIQNEIQRITTRLEGAISKKDFEEAAVLREQQAVLIDMLTSLRERIREAHDRRKPVEEDSVSCCVRFQPGSVECIRRPEVDEAVNCLCAGSQLVLIGATGCGCTTMLGAIADKLSQINPGRQAVALLLPDFQEIETQILSLSVESLFGSLADVFLASARHILLIRALHILADRSFPVAQREAWKHLIRDLQREHRAILATSTPEGWQTLTALWPNLMSKFISIRLGPLSKSQFGQVLKERLSESASDTGKRVELHRTAISTLLSRLPEHYLRYPAQAVYLANTILKLAIRKPKNRLFVDAKVVDDALREIIHAGEP
jgi:hypothetical protein